MKRSPSCYTCSNTKKDKIPQKQESVSAFYSTVGLIEVDIKVTSASLPQNQCLHCVTPPLTHVEIPRPRDATELNNDGLIKFVDVHYQIEPNLSIFPKEI